MRNDDEMTKLLAKQRELEACVLGFFVEKVGPKHSINKGNLIEWFEKGLGRDRDEVDQAIQRLLQDSSLKYQGTQALVLTAAGKSWLESYLRQKAEDGQKSAQVVGTAGVVVAGNNTSVNIVGGGGWEQAISVLRNAKASLPESTDKEGLSQHLSAIEEIFSRAFSDTQPNHVKGTTPVAMTPDQEALAAHKANQMKVLRASYNLSRRGRQDVIFDLYEIERESMLSAQEVEEAVEALKTAGLMQQTTTQYVSITPDGVKEVERSIQPVPAPSEFWSQHQPDLHWPCWFQRDR